VTSTHTVDRAGCEHLGVAHQQGTAPQAQGLLHAGHNEKHPDARLLDEVAERVESVVAGVVAPGEAMFVENLLEAWRATAR